MKCRLVLVTLLFVHGALFAAADLHGAWTDGSMEYSAVKAKNARIIADHAVARSRNAR